MRKFICKDYTVSGKEFELVYDSKLELFATYPQPDEKDLESYYQSPDYISHTDSKKTLIDKIYQSVKKLSLSKKIKLIESFNTPDKYLLDIGCGTGDFLEVAKRKHWKVTGIEPNEQARKLSQVKIDDSKVIVSELNKLTGSKQKSLFDVITLWHVLEHVPDLNKYIALIKTFLKPTGVLVVAVPNFKSYDAQRYKEFWAAYDVPRHLWHFSQNSISKLFSKHSMKVIAILPMRFDSYYVSLLSEKYKTGKSNFFSAFWFGFLSNWKARKTKEYSSLIYLLKISNLKASPKP